MKTPVAVVFPLSSCPLISFRFGPENKLLELVARQVFGEVQVTDAPVMKPPPGLSAANADALPFAPGRLFQFAAGTTPPRSAGNSELVAASGSVAPKFSPRNKLFVVTTART